MHLNGHEWSVEGQVYDVPRSKKRGPTYEFGSDEKPEAAPKTVVETEPVTNETVEEE